MTNDGCGFRSSNAAFSEFGLSHRKEMLGHLIDSGYRHQSAHSDWTFESQLRLEIQTADQLMSADTGSTTAFARAVVSRTNR
jgi:hypothetical protein